MEGLLAIYKYFSKRASHSTYKLSTPRSFFMVTLIKTEGGLLPLLKRGALILSELRPLKINTLVYLVKLVIRSTFAMLHRGIKARWRTGH